MTSANMLARVRTLLDEASAGFWTDAEIYSALSDGQREVVDILFAKSRKHNLLKSLLKTASDTDTTSSAITLPTDFKEFINASYTTLTTEDKLPCKIVDYDEIFLRDKDNTYLTPIRATPVVYLSATTGLRLIYFEPTSIHCDYSILYLKQPTEIASGTEPILPPETHEAIIMYAFSFVLRKDMRQAEADSALKTFTNLAGIL